MFENICSLPLSSDLFALALHPTRPILTVGLSAGHVHTYKLPDPHEASVVSSPESPASVSETDGIPRRSSLRRTSSASAASDSGFGVVETVWRTKRHKGSCRAVAFSPDGNFIFSAGSDGLVKAARTDDGKVVAKIAIPVDEKGFADPPCALHILTPNHLILSTDSSAVHIYSLSISASSTCTISSRPTTTHHPHVSFLSSLTPLPLPENSTSTTGYPKQFLSIGGTTLTITDLRRGTLAVSAPQDSELLASVFVSGLRRGGTSQGAKAVVGDSSGVLSLFERGVWDDLDERIIVDKINSESIESLTTVPDNAVARPQGEHKLLVCGLGDGKIRFVRLGINKVLKDWDLQHDELEGVTALGFDAGGRLVSGGGEIVKLWREKMPTPLNGNGSGKKRSLQDNDDDESNDNDSEDLDDHDQEEAYDTSDNDNNSSSSIIAAAAAATVNEEGSKKRRKKKKKKGKQDVNSGSGHAHEFSFNFS